MSNFESVRQIAARLVEERRERRAAYLSALHAEAKREQPEPLFNAEDLKFMKECGMYDEMSSASGPTARDLRLSRTYLEVQEEMGQRT